MAALTKPLWMVGIDVGSFPQKVEPLPEFDGRIAFGCMLIKIEEPLAPVFHLLAAVRIDPENEVSDFLLASVYKALGMREITRKKQTCFRRFELSAFVPRSEDRRRNSSPAKSPSKLRIQKCRLRRCFSRI